MSHRSTSTDPSAAHKRLRAAAKNYATQHEALSKRKTEAQRAAVLDADDELDAAACAFATEDALAVRSNDLRAEYIRKVIDWLASGERTHRSRAQDFADLAVILNASCFTTRWKATDARDLLDACVRLMPESDLDRTVEAAARIVRENTDAQTKELDGCALVSASADERRWLDAGRSLRKLDPAALDKLVQTIAESTTHDEVRAAAERFRGVRS